jgi:hypothetical protein
MHVAVSPGLNPSTAGGSLHLEPKKLGEAVHDHGVIPVWIVERLGN